MKRIRNRVRVHGVVLSGCLLVATCTQASQAPLPVYGLYNVADSLKNNMQQPYYTAPYLLSDALASRQGIALVVCVQRALAQREYYTGDIDGIVGQETETALFLFQMDLELNITGSINSATLEKLNIHTPEWFSQ